MLYRPCCALVDGYRLSAVEGITWSQANALKDAKHASSGARPAMTSTSGGAALQRKISDDDDDDASDSEKMVICEDEPAGMDIYASW